MEEMGLPADYDKLTDTQKNAVTSIEAMLSYLESKYQEEFCLPDLCRSRDSARRSTWRHIRRRGTPSDVVTVCIGHMRTENIITKMITAISESDLCMRGRVREFARTVFPGERDQSIQRYPELRTGYRRTKCIGGKCTADCIGSHVHLHF